MKKILMFMVLLAFFGCSDLNKKNNTKVQIKGQFIYFADAATIKLNDSYEVFPVQGGESYLELEKEYLLKRSEPMASVYVELEGRFETVPKMEGKGSEQVFKVDRILTIKSNN